MNTSFTIRPGSLQHATRASLARLQKNLSANSPWVELTEAQDDASRNNSPYYGPATQFLIDIFLGLAEQNPEIYDVRQTPLERCDAADFLMKEYIGKRIVGGAGLAAAYEGSAMARTNAHQRRFQYLHRDVEHVVLGAYVPFEDMARVCGGVVLKQAELGSTDNPVEVVDRSTQLQIVAGVKGDQTPKYTSVLSRFYILPEYIEETELGSMRFSEEALDVIRPLLSSVGCPTAKISEGGVNLFTEYWSKIGSYLLEDTDRDKIIDEHDKRRSFVHSKVPAKPTKPTPPKSKKKHPKASKRYTPSKSK